MRFHICICIFKFGPAQPVAAPVQYAAQVAAPVQYAAQVAAPAPVQYAAHQVAAPVHYASVSIYTKNFHCFHSL